MLQHVRDVGASQIALTSACVTVASTSAGRAVMTQVALSVRGCRVRVPTNGAHTGAAVCDSAVDDSAVWESVVDDSAVWESAVDDSAVWESAVDEARASEVRVRLTSRG